MRYILCCSCFNMENRSREAFSLLFPNEVSPDIIRGKDRIYKFSKLVDNEHIKSISRLSGKFAYYIELDGDKIIKEYDLLKGKRIA